VRPGAREDNAFAMDVAAESVRRVLERRQGIGGLRMTYEPRYPRFFQARFEPPGGDLG
jgi:tyrosine phenol-lyase